MTHSVFVSWKKLEFLTLENIMVGNVIACLKLIGKQLRGLKVNDTRALLLFLRHEGLHGGKCI
jgi:hypothetical protein